MEFFSAEWLRIYCFIVIIFSIGGFSYVGFCFVLFDVLEVVLFL